MAECSCRSVNAHSASSSCCPTQVNLTTPEQALHDGRPYLVGGRLTTADMLLTTCLSWAVSYGVPITGACHAYMDRITSRPTYGTALAANAPRTA
jgi:glutathione S-transferase